MRGHAKVILIPEPVNVRTPPAERNFADVVNLQIFKGSTSGSAYGTMRFLGIAPRPQASHTLDPLSHLPGS